MISLSIRFIWENPYQKFFVEKNNVKWLLNTYFLHSRAQVTLLVFYDLIKTIRTKIQENFGKFSLRNKRNDKEI